MIASPSVEEIHILSLSIAFVYRQMNPKLDQVYLQRGYKRPNLLSIHLAQLLQEPFLEELLVVRLDHGLDLKIEFYSIVTMK